MKIILKRVTGYGTMLALLVGVVQLFAFFEPTSIPPISNLSLPIMVNSIPQAKVGDFILANSAKNAVLTTDLLSTRGGGIINVDKAPVGLLIPEGNVGIGTTQPDAKLDIKGPLKIGGLENFTPVEGMIYYDPSSKDWLGYAEGEWVSLKIVPK